jgi:hypothetical protein
VDTLHALVQSIRFEYFWAAVTALTVTVAWSAWSSFFYMRQTRRVEDMALSKIRSASQGYVELQGIVSPMGDEIRSPLTGTPCVWWHYTVDDIHDRRKENRGSEAPFYLDDGTGRCIVYPAGIRTPFAAMITRKWQGGPERPQVLARHGYGYVSQSQGKGRYQYVEQLLFAGNPVFIMGLFSTLTKDPTAADPDAELRKKLAAWKQDPQQMKLLDVNHDGKVDAREWEAARLAAKQQLLRESLAHPRPPGIDTLSRPLSRNQPFILAPYRKSTMHAVSRYMARASFRWIMCGGGLLATLLFLRGVG